MAFDPATLDIRKGETIRIVLTNEGSFGREFVMATPDEIADHREEMRGIGDMPQDATSAPRVEPGRSETFVWTFANAGSYAFVCLVPGHCEAGLHGRLAVA